MMERQLTYQAEEADSGRSVKEILRQEFQLSARQISRAKFLERGITVNGEEVTVRRILRAGDRLAVRLEDGEAGSDQLIPQPGELDIRYEDEDLILINKPAGLVVHPSPGHYTDSLANILVWHYGQRGEHLVVRPVGRLDRETSGLIYIAKNKAAVRWMELQRISGELERRYLALVHGCPAQPEGLIEAPIAPSAKVWMKQEVREGGVPAKTAYRVRKRLDGYSLVELRLFTGRTHQIRVHMAHIGHPLLGDDMYAGGWSHAGADVFERSGISGQTGEIKRTGESEQTGKLKQTGEPKQTGKSVQSGISAENEYGMTRTALHSWKIICTQPFTGERLEFVCKLPEDMEKLAEIKI